jgi:uncharacterized protein YhbP (UPF0306 family)
VNDWTDDLVQLIFDSSFMTLATADSEGVPWASPVEFACDEALRFYWVSVFDARHSRNVEANPHAALSIYDSTQTPGVAAVQGLYGEGPVEMLHGADLDAVRPILNRWVAWRDAGRDTSQSRRGGVGFGGDMPWRFYRLTPTQLYALDPSPPREQGSLVDWRAPVDLGEGFLRAYRSRMESSR